MTDRHADHFSLAGAALPRRLLDSPMKFIGQIDRRLDHGTNIPYIMYGNMAIALTACSGHATGPAALGGVPGNPRSTVRPSRQRSLTRQTFGGPGTMNSAARCSPPIASTRSCANSTSQLATHSREASPARHFVRDRPGARRRPAARRPAPEQAAISAVTLCGLHHGVLIATDKQRPGRLATLILAEKRFAALPIDARIAPHYGRLVADARRSHNKKLATHTHSSPRPQPPTSCRSSHATATSHTSTA